MQRNGSRWLAGLLAPLCLAGCAALDRAGGAGGEPAVSSAPSTTDRDTTAALLLAGTVQSLQRLAQGAPAEQAEIVSVARMAFERAPMGGAQLRYALTLATSGFSARDPEAARGLLRQLAAEPAQLAPLERAMTLISLATLERELGLKSENDRLQSEAGRNDSQRQAVANRRLQTALEENARLKRLLEQAQAKLDAIATIERNLSGR